MKSIITIIFTSILFFSCEEMLIEEPKSLAVETFYNTSSEVQSALAAVYSPLHNYSGMGGFYPAMLESFVDYGYGRGSWASNSNFQGLDGTNVTRTGAFWDLFYLSIRNANIVIQNVPNGKNLTDADKAKYVGEARFLRAFNYFCLVKNWGGVPLRTVDNMTEPNLKRSTSDEIFQLIYADLAYAEANLPDDTPVAGRPSKWAAKTLLADVYFYQGKNAEARDKAKEVILANKYSLVTVNVADDFSKIYGPEVITTSEEIFYLKFSRLGTGQGWGLVMFAHHPGSKLHGAGGYYGHYSDKESNPVVKGWDKNDLRYTYGWYSWNIGLGTNTLLYKKYVDPLAPTYIGAGNDYPLYRYADVLLMYAEADCRASGTVNVDAMEKLNMVHRRAYGKNPLIPDVTVDFKTADYTNDTFIDLVLKERGYETIFEGKRWHDLKRSGKLKDIIKAATGKDVADKHLLWPIPVSEINFNKAIDPIKDQNPGY